MSQTRSQTHYNKQIAIDRLIAITDNKSNSHHTAIQAFFEKREDDV